MAMVSAALVLLLTVPTAGPASTESSASGSSIAWLRDDYPAALADARANRRPVFIDVWASWCHTCLSMKNYVMTDQRLKEEHDRFTWLELEFDNERNAAFFAKFPVNAVPTYFVLDANGRVRGRKIGACSLEQMRSFLVRSRGTDALVAAEQKLAQGHYGAARKMFARLEAHNAKVGPGAKSRFWAGYIEALSRSDKAACARVGRRAIGELPAFGESIETMGMIASCADGLPARHKEPVARALRTRLTPWSTAKLDDLTADDRSTLLGLLIDAADHLDDEATATAALTQRKTLLEQAAASAPTAAARATFDDHRLSVYMRLHQYGQALRMLEASEAAQPKDFNHPWRQARVYRAMGDATRGLAAIERALVRGYGARSIRLYSTKIDLLVDAGRRIEAQKTIAEARRKMADWPSSQLRTSWRNEFRKASARATSAPPNKDG